jgi:peroxin-6
MTTVLKECLDTIKEGWMSSGYPVVVVATTTDIEKVPTGVLGLFKEEIGIEVRTSFFALLALLPR